MHFQSIAHGTGVFAQIAFVRLFSRMRPHVNHEMRPLNERFVAHFAFVGFLARVSSGVYDQALFRRVTLSTVLAIKARVVGVNLPV